MRALAARAHVEYPQNFTTQLRVLRGKAPEGFNAVVAKYPEDPRGAMADLMRLAEEHDVDLALPMRNRRGGGERMERGERQEGRPEPRKVNLPPMRKLREKFPEEMKRYEELKRQDPNAAAKLLRELAAKLDSDKPEHKDRKDRKDRKRK